MYELLNCLISVPSHSGAECEVDVVFTAIGTDLLLKEGTCLMGEWLRDTAGAELQRALRKSLRGKDVATEGEEEGPPHDLPRPSSTAALSRMSVSTSSSAPLVTAANAEAIYTPLSSTMKGMYGLQGVIHLALRDAGGKQSKKTLTPENLRDALRKGMLLADEMGMSSAAVEFPLAPHMSECSSEELQQVMEAVRRISLIKLSRAGA